MLLTVLVPSLAPGLANGVLPVDGAAYECSMQCVDHSDHHSESHFDARCAPGCTTPGAMISNELADLVSAGAPLHAETGDRLPVRDLAPEPFPPRPIPPRT